ncbi:hypothetical protein Gp_37 [Bacillus phage vB_Bacillus_1020A]|jgi:hypothetical protein|nr:hypothetical protein [Robertmurraya sp. DFI.2.37]MDF1510829.1 hypothetical protein [Robertmurraya sp. DFI.2.37]QIW89311.1 hypothetical protein Gp_37 [Bacillus phage vB_Bacillus_1020A]
MTKTFISVLVDKAIINVLENKGILTTEEIQQEVQRLKENEEGK